MAGSALGRIFSGSVASWIRIGINLVVQLCGAPIFLGHWNAETYGLWLAFLAATGFLQIVDSGHQSFLENEFLRLGLRQRDQVEVSLSAGIPIGAVLGTIELLAVIALVHFGGLSLLVAAKSANHQALVVLLVMQSITWLVFGSVGGLFVRCLSVFGYYSRFSWWGTLLQAFTAILPLVAVLRGGGILAAGLAMFGGVTMVNLAMYVDVWRICRREQIRLSFPDFRVGLGNLVRSLVLTVRTTLEMLRQQGARLILAPLAGVVELAAFATTRTGANVALQGLSTVTQPLMPELMRFLNQGDRARAISSLGAVWFVLLIVMVPGALVLQVVAPMIFDLWTRGKIAFDPPLFALFSSGVLVFALGQPAQAIVTGNNLLRPLLTLSIIGAVVTVGGMFVLVPIVGVLGAAWALLAAEIATTIGYTVVAASWMRRREMEWPWTENSLLIGVTFGTGICLLLMAALPAWRWGLLGVALCVDGGAIWLYWRQLPMMVRQRLSGLLASRVLVLQRLFA